MLWPNRKASSTPSPPIMSTRPDATFEDMKSSPGPPISCFVAPSQVVMMSSPASPKSCSSWPLQPWTSSAPSPPLMSLTPTPPRRLSAPAPPVSLSAPAPPSRNARRVVAAATVMVSSPPLPLAMMTLVTPVHDTVAPPPVHGSVAVRSPAGSATVNAFVPVCVIVTLLGSSLPVATRFMDPSTLTAVSAAAGAVRASVSASAPTRLRTSECGVQRRRARAPSNSGPGVVSSRWPEMITPTTPTDTLVDALASRLRRMDLVGWQQIATVAEESELSFEDLRLLLALEVKRDEGPAPISELADIAGFSLDVAYPAIHRLRGRGYLSEEGRRYSLSEQGRELFASLDAAHREGIKAYVDDLDPEERRQLEKAFGMESPENE